MTCKNSTLTQARLKELLHYDPETGLFTWLTNRGRNKTKGLITGCISSYDGYVAIGLDGLIYRAHRLAVLYMTGHFPSVVDHINRIRHDNRWCNIRTVSYSENMENTIRNVAFIGVHFHKKSNKWRAVTKKINGKRTHLGQFSTHFAACYCRHVYNIGVRNV